MTSNFTEGGVRLSLPGFREYIKNLAEAEKVQQRVFNTEYKKLGLSYSRVTAEARKYEQQLKQTSQAQSKFNRLISGVQKVAGGIGLGGPLGGALVGGAGAAAAGAAIKATIDFTKESAKLAESFRGQLTALDNLSEAYGANSSAIRGAIREAAQGTLSETDIILSANRALQLDVARSSGEFRRLTEDALILGKSLGLDATEAIDRFTVALGRKSFPILDDFGIKAAQVNEQIAILGQQRFGKAFEDLSAAQKDALFVAAALQVADERAQAIGTDILETAGSFDRLEASSKNFSLVIGTALTPSVQQLNDLLSGTVDLATDVFIDLAGAFVGFNAALNASSQNVGGLFDELLAGEATLQDFLFGKDVTNLNEFLFGTGEPKKSLDELVDIGLQARQDFIDQLKDVQGKGPVTEDDVNTARDYEQALEDEEAQLKQIESALRRAEQLQLSFTRAQEDAARKQARQLAKLNRDQVRAREKLLSQQTKSFDEFEQDRSEQLAEFEEDRLKQIANAERDILKEQDRARREQRRQIERFHREIRQSEERFNLDRIQSQRRFGISETRLRSEGDILGLQRLREDFRTSEQEAAENFDLQQRQAKENQREQTKDQEEEQRNRLGELKQQLAEQRKELEIDLEERREQLLKSFDEQLADLNESQAEQRQALLTSFAEAEQDRAIQQQRQLEDLGRSLTEQEGLTQEGGRAIADRIQEFFGTEGVADQIYSGFTARQEKRFEDLYDNLEEIVRKGQRELEEQANETPFLPIITKDSGGRRDPLHLPIIQKFHEGGTVGGPPGSEQLGLLRAGERVFTQQQMQSVRMPVAAPEQLNINLSGRSLIDVNAPGASREVIDATLREVNENLRIVLQRMARAR